MNDCVTHRIFQVVGQNISHRAAISLDRYLIRALRLGSEAYRGMWRRFA